MKPRSRMLLVLLLAVAGLFGCNSETKRENPKLRELNSDLTERVANLTRETDSLRSILLALQETDNYYYQTAVKLRQEKSYEESMGNLDVLIERFPRSNLVVDARKLREQNQKDFAQQLYDQAVQRKANGDLSGSEANCNLLNAKYPGMAVTTKARKLLDEIQREREKREEDAAKAGSDLELIKWSWSATAGGSYVEAKGQVRNISGRRLEAVEAVVTIYDKNGDFIMSDGALIEYNPILPGQVSPFKVLETHNPAMASASVSFKYLMGGSIPTYHKDRK